MKTWIKYSMSGWPIMIALLLLIICSQITIASYRNTCRIWKTENKRQVELIERLSVWRSKLEDQDHNCMNGITELLPAGYTLDINQEYVKLFYTSTNEPYRSWTIYYSDGMRRNKDGKWISLYREPTMQHLDMRKWEGD